MLLVPSSPLTRDVFTQAALACTALVFERTSFRSAYGSRGGFGLIVNKEIQDKRANPLFECGQQRPLWVLGLARLSKRLATCHCNMVNGLSPLS